MPKTPKSNSREHIVPSPVLQGGRCLNIIPERQSGKSAVRNSISRRTRVSVNIIQIAYCTSLKKQRLRAVTEMVSQRSGMTEAGTKYKRLVREETRGTRGTRNGILRTWGSELSRRSSRVENIAARQARDRAATVRQIELFVSVNRSRRSSKEVTSSNGSRRNLEGSGTRPARKKKENRRKAGQPEGKKESKAVASD